MPGLLYLETNYLIGVAEGRTHSLLADLDREGILPILAIPGMCVLEAFSVLERRRKETTRFLATLEVRLGEVGRDRTSPHALALSRHLEEAMTGILAQHNDFELRLNAAIAELADRAEWIEAGPAVARSALAASLVEKDPTDNLILHGILRHARSSPARDRGFLSENTTDFKAPLVRAALREAGVRGFTRPDDAIGWLRSLDRRRHGRRPSP